MWASRTSDGDKSDPPIFSRTLRNRIAYRYGDALNRGGLPRQRARGSYREEL